MLSLGKLEYWRSKAICALVISLTGFVPFSAHAADDLHDLYDVLQQRGRVVTIPAKVLGRLKLGLPSSDISGREILVTETDRDRRGITAFELAGVPTITVFHIEPNKDD